MANMGTTLSVAETLLAALQTSMVEQMCSKWDFESELEDLKMTVSETRKVLLDAEAEQELGDEMRHSIQKLKDVVYDADDLFDVLLTTTNQRKGRLRGDKLPEKVRGFLSDNTMSQWVKNIMDQLYCMANSRRKFSFEVNYQPIREDFSDRNVFIGREDDMNAVKDFLFESKFEDDVSFLAIVGGRGSGKTTLTQLVYHDKRVRSEFPLRLGIDVSNEDGKEVQINEILGKILESSGRYYTDKDDMLQRDIPQVFGGKKYLLVLDHICIEDHHKWLNLRKFLMYGGRGSRIIIVTSSKETARVIGSEHTYELNGLSKENSRRLFELAAFGEGLEHVSHPELVAIGEKIVEECCGVPLAIKVVGSLLYGQDISKWRLFEEHVSLARVGDNGEEKIMWLLKLSYHNLEPHLKSCLTYCAMFRKGFIIDKKKLFRLWIAQGYIVSLDSQSLEDVAEDYFLILLQRCLLQSVERNGLGKVVSCRLHSLMHDIALEVDAAQEMRVVDSITDDLGVNVRHLHHVGRKCSESSFHKIKIRSYLRDIYLITPIDNILSSWMWLRVLDLHKLNIESLPDSIGKLLHLRYLDLSDNRLERLPNSITKLHNLQTLNLNGCAGFRELPRDLMRLVNLRNLIIDEGRSMTHMPIGIHKLTCLHSLTAFVVAKESFVEEDSSSEGEKSCVPKPCMVGMLKDLKSLTNLRGSISISIPRNYKNVDDIQSLEASRSGGYLGGMEHLNEVSLDFHRDELTYYFDKTVIDHEPWLEKLRPHPNLKGIALRRYTGMTLSSWATSLPNLVTVDIRSARGLRQLSFLSKLQHLKSLILSELSNLEYMEETTSSTTTSSSNDEEPQSLRLTFFPSLVYLSISCMPKLKAWWEDENDINRLQPSFCCLYELSMTDCCKLKSFPPCPTVVKLHLGGLDENFEIMKVRNGPHNEDSRNYQPLELKEVTNYRNISHLNSLPTSSLTSICITWGNKVERLSEVEEAFKNCSSSLRNLTITGCDNLTSVSGALEHLTALESLKIMQCQKLAFSEEDTAIWRSFHRSLSSLELHHVDSMEILPKGMQYLTTLQDLTIKSCLKLKVIPEWISCLSSLTAFRVSFCDQLQSLPETMRDLTSLKLLDLSYCNKGMEKRCQNPNGEDWPKIQHIPCIVMFP